MATKQHNRQRSQLPKPLCLNPHHPPFAPKTIPKHLRHSNPILQRHKPAVCKPNSMWGLLVHENKVWRGLGVGHGYCVLSYGKLNCVLLVLLSKSFFCLLIWFYNTDDIWYPDSSEYGAASSGCALCTHWSFRWRYVCGWPHIRRQPRRKLFRQFAIPGSWTCGWCLFLRVAELESEDGILLVCAMVACALKAFSRPKPHELVSRCKGWQ